MAGGEPTPGSLDPERRRLFIGLTLGEDEAARLLRRVRPHFLGPEGHPEAGVRVYEPRDLHLTLGFLGSFPEVDRARLQGVLQEELRGLEAPDLHLEGLGAFPNVAEPRSVWVGVRECERRPGRLWALRNRAWQAALSLGWRPGGAERRREFRPHVTVARWPRQGPQPPLPPSLERLDFSQAWLPVDVHLFESQPDRPEQRYHSLAAVPLVVRPG